MFFHRGRATFKVILVLLDESFVQNHHSKSNTDVTFSPYAQFGTDHHGALAIKDGHLMQVTF
jgi:hypothetical protein